MITVTLLGLALAAETVIPLPHAHAHNDYWQRRPLEDALNLGFMSVEADVFLRNGRLLVGHDPRELRPNRTLRDLYLGPLAERANRNGGRIYPGAGPLILLVDIKADPEAAYAQLKKEMAEFPSSVWSSWRSGQPVRQGAVTVVLSGARPIETVKKETERSVFLDGRLSDLSPNETDAELIPLISASWPENFRWRGQGPFPLAEAAKLRFIVSRAHAQQQKVRFWATPEFPAVWRELRSLGVDFIGTDKLPDLARFFRETTKEGR